jgi:hypothetical protein
MGKGWSDHKKPSESYEPDDWDSDFLNCQTEFDFGGERI